jgi:hypothetical protein
MAFSLLSPASQSERIGRESGHRFASVIVEVICLSIGAGLLMLAMVINRRWLDRHVLPHMFLTHDPQILWWAIERGAAFGLGLALICLVRPWAGRRVREGKGKDLFIQCALVAISIALSGLASEIILRTISWRKIDRWAATEEPLRAADPHLGWANVPARTGVDMFYGHRIAYHLDAEGHRIAAPGRPVDYTRPSILFSGESIMFGFRLNWPDTITGRIEAATGLQSANLAVNGYSTDQAFMRLATDLPRFTKPVAVVALFAPTLMERNLDGDRPHLDAVLRWHPAHDYWRLRRLVKNVALYHRTRRIDEGIKMTQAVLRATVLAAHVRHAEALILVPSFGPEQPVERDIRRRVLDDAKLPYVEVSLDPRWHVPHDGHPDARADDVMARAIMAGLKRERPDIFTGR